MSKAAEGRKALESDGSSAAMTPEWLAAMLRNYIEQDDVVKENAAVIVQMPNDPTARCRRWRCRSMAERQDTPAAFADKRCMWSFATTRRCKNVATTSFDTRTMRAYYCPEHLPVVGRLMAGSGR